MKPMIYTHLRTKEILHDGLYKNYYFVIVSYGVHPCAYVRVPKNHPFYKRDYNELDITCHGGLTFGDDLKHVIPNDESDAWYVGWDYAHVGDYEILSNIPNFSFIEGKQWTTEEIYEDVKRVIDQLINYEDTKRIRNCTYKEVRAYYEENPVDWEVGALLGAFGKAWQRNEESWKMRMQNDFPRIFQKELLDKLIKVK